MSNKDKTINKVCRSVHLETDLDNKLQAMALKNDRSFSAEVVLRLIKSLEQDETLFN